MARILIVEDEESINTLIQMNLELVGHECTSIFDGQSALNVLKRETFDLILLDVMLPEKDGFQVIEEIKDQVSIIFFNCTRFVI